MNQITAVVTTLLHYKAVVRDTLEYTLPRDSYDVNVYKEKKRAILVELEEPTPLKNILQNSGDNGKNLEKLIRDFHEQVYGDSSTILKAAEDGLRVDHAQHLAIFKPVLQIHENVEMMIGGLIRDAKSKGVDVARVEEVDRAEERLYRAVSYLSLTAQLVKLFQDYNQARREAKGEETPASRFIGNDIQETVQGLNTIRAHSHLTDERYNGVQDKVFMLIDFMTGRRDLPMGKGFPQVIQETQDAIMGYVREVEPAYHQAYDPLVRELAEEAAKHGNKIVPDGTAGAEAPAKPQEAEIEGEIDPKTGLPRA